MAETETAAPRKRGPYAPRQSRAERKAAKHEAVLDSIPDELSEELRAKAMRQADRERENMPVDEEEQVWVEVQEEGDGKISSGLYVSGAGNVHYDEGERFQAPKSIVQGLRKRHYVFYVDGPHPDGD